MIPTAGKQYRFGDHTITFAFGLRAGSKFSVRSVLEIDGVAPRCGDRIPRWLGRPDDPYSPLSVCLRADAALLANVAANALTSTK